MWRRRPPRGEGPCGPRGGLASPSAPAVAAPSPGHIGVVAARVRSPPPGRPCHRAEIAGAASSGASGPPGVLAPGMAEGGTSSVAAQRRAGTPPAAPGSVDRREPGGSRTRATPLKDRAYEAIKHHIITCRFAPGEDLNEAQVAGRLNLSLMPVRHALARLRLEGLVAIARARASRSARPTGGSSCRSSRPARSTSATARGSRPSALRPRSWPRCSECSGAPGRPSPPATPRR
jgi:hypothetical protein